MRPAAARHPVIAVWALTLALPAAACGLDKSGLGTMFATIDGGGDAQSTGAGGTGGLGSGGRDGGTGGAGGLVATSGAGGTTGNGGSGAGGAGGGAAGTGGSGAGGATGSGGSGAGGAAGSGGGLGGAGGDGQPDAGTTPDASTPPDARPTSLAGCADGTREGYLNMTTYPGIAACAGAWSVPGLHAGSTRTPTCGRRSGNGGGDTINDGAGCTVADLCAEGWHVCETAVEVAQHAADCTDAFTTSTDNGNFFYVTRQRGFGPGMSQCFAANNLGSNNIHGCALSGVNELGSCAPFHFSWSHDECDNNRPWMCGMDMNDVMEGDEVTKPGNNRGGALCCRD